MGDSKKIGKWGQKKSTASRNQPSFSIYVFILYEKLFLYAMCDLGRSMRNYIYQ